MTITDFDFVSYAEESDNTGPVIATYQGTVAAELTCKGVSANLQLIDCDTKLVVSKIAVADLVSVDGLTYTFTQQITGANMKKSYKGKLIAFDTNNAADTAIKELDC